MMLKDLTDLFFKKWSASRRHILKLLLVMLLILQVGTAYAVPSGAHFKLCIGFDGHIDVSLDGCGDEISDAIDYPQHPGGRAHNDDHHGDCVDISMGCVSFDKLRTTITGVCISNETAKVNSTISVAGSVTGVCSQSLTQYSTPNAYHQEGDAFPSQRIDSLRTTILLI